MSNVVPFDTLALASSLRDEAGLDQKQAEGFARVLSRALVGDMATKGDLAQEASSIRSELAHESSTIRTELAAKIETTVAEAKTEVIKWLFGTIVAQTGIIIAAVKLLH